MVKLFTNEKEINRAIKAAVDQANKMKKKKKSMHELCKEFPNKTYREVEKYRELDRWEEAIGIGHNHPPKDEENGVE
tara:strand:- start:87 stop:317 length:231 start_codon:yes stop_codon:yes gene_type:complete